MDLQGLYEFRDRVRAGAYDLADRAAYYLPPEARKIGANVAALADLFSVGADVRGAVQGSGRAADAVRQGDALGAVGGGAEMLSNLASLFMPGSGSGMGEALGIFAGIGARNADRAALEAAEAMERAGASPDDIWRATGWGRGADQDWRFEIDDRGARMSNPAQAEFARGARELSAPLWRLFDHFGLKAAYPETAEFPATVRLGDGGSFDTGTFEITAGGTSPGQVRGTMLHELQHVVQQGEDFARGGNPATIMLDPALRSQWLAKADELLAPPAFDEAFVQNYGGGLSPEETRGLYDDVVRASEAARRDPYHFAAKAAQETAAQDIYRRLAGEVEARNVKARADMPAEQRRQTPPWATEDVPRDQQIVRRR